MGTFATCLLASFWKQHFIFMYLLFSDSSLVQMCVCEVHLSWSSWFGCFIRVLPLTVTTVMQQYCCPQYSSWFILWKVLLTAASKGRGEAWTEIKKRKLQQERSSGVQKKRGTVIVSTKQTHACLHVFHYSNAVQTELKKLPHLHCLFPCCQFFLIAHSLGLSF